MSVTIPAEFESFVERAVASGRYRSEDEVFANALRLLSERERRWLALRDDIQVGLDDIESGDVAPLDVEDIKQRGRQRLAERIARS